MSVYGRQKTDGENSDMTDKQEERESDMDRGGISTYTRGTKINESRDQYMK